jgi:hypothetical protein
MTNLPNNSDGAEIRDASLCPAGVPAASKEPDKQLATCALVMRFVGGLFLFGGGLYLLFGLLGGEWKEFCGRAWSPGMSMLLGVAAVVAPLAILLLASGVRRGNVGAARAAALVGWTVLPLLGVNAWTTGNAFYEVALWLGMLIHIHIGLHHCLRRQRQRASSAR